jgi:hypothetical protein
LFIEKGLGPGNFFEEVGSFGGPDEGLRILVVVVEVATGDPLSFSGHAG